MSGSNVWIFLLLVNFAACNNTVTTPSSSPDKWQVFTTSNSLISNDHIYDIFVDNQKRIWFATHNGAFYFDRSYWGATLRDSLCTVIGKDTTCIVYSIGQSKDAALWFATKLGGVVRYQPISNNNIWTRFTERNGATDHPLSLAGDRTDPSVFGEMWVTSLSGINQFIQSANESGTWKTFQMGDLSYLPTNEVWVVEINQADKSIWFGTQTGGSVKAEYSPGGILHWTLYDLPPDLNSKINSIAFDLDNMVWFGTETHGVVMFSRTDGSWGQYSQESTRYSKGSSGGVLPHGPVRTVLTDYLRTRWFGTDSGLVYLRDSTWSRFTTVNSPLPSDTVTALQYDSRGNLWIGTPSGIAVYNEEGLSF